MNYAELSREDFDAIVTGELTHLAIALEDQLNSIITSYFVQLSKERQDLFKNIILLRDGLTAQDKIELTRAIFSFSPMEKAHKEKWDDLLHKIQEFNSLRNAMAHGLDKTPEPYNGTICVEIISRSGKAKLIEITPKSHEEMMDKINVLYARVQEEREILFNSTWF